jgi:transposase
MRKMTDEIVSGKKIFVGLEDAKRTWKLCVRCEGMIVHEVSMPAEYRALHRYLTGRYPGCHIVVMYETGFSGFNLYDKLTGDGIGCVVTPAHTVQQAKVSRVKTDRTDARLLAGNLEAGRYVVCRVPDRQQREDRQVSRTTSQLQRHIVSVKNQIRRFLEFHGLDEGFPAGRWRESHYRELAITSLPHSLQISLEALQTLLATMEKLHAGLRAELKHLSQQPRYQPGVTAKASCPGVGWLSAIRFTLEWGEMKRFASGEQLASFVGLTASEASSGESTHRGHITGQGSGQVRAWLIQCAWRAIRLDPVLLHKFRAVWSASSSKKKAIVAVARKLALRMRTVEITGQPYVIGVER